MRFAGPRLPRPPPSSVPAKRQRPARSSRASRGGCGFRAARQAAASLPFFSSSERFTTASASIPDFTSTVAPTST